LEKRQRQFDKAVEEWKLRLGELQAELEKSQKETRIQVVEVQRLKGLAEETHELSETLKKENKRLTGQNLSNHLDLLTFIFPTTLIFRLSGSECF